MSKRILIYYPFNLKSASTRAQARVLLDLGYEVYLLTWAKEGLLHKDFVEIGVKTFSAYSDRYVKGPLFFIHHTLFLRRFLRKHNIDKVISHIQSNGMVAGLALLFHRQRTFYCRHNSDYFELRNSRKELFINSMANKLSHRIIAISDKVRQQLMKEGVAKAKIARVDLCYDFKAFGTPDADTIAGIRRKYNADIILLVAARLDPLKRHRSAIEVVKGLLKKGIDVKLLCIGNGEEREGLLTEIRNANLEESVFLLGFIPDVINYYAACDVLLNLSYSEASSHVTKEAGICGKPVIVCRGVGDFDDYLVNGENGFLVDKEDPVAECVNIVTDLCGNTQMLKQTGRNLLNTIYERFSMDAVREQYRTLLR